MATLIDMILKSLGSNAESISVKIEGLKSRKQKLEQTIEKLNQLIEFGESEVEKTDVINDFLGMLGGIDKRVRSAYTPETKKQYNDTLDEWNNVLDDMKARLMTYYSYNVFMHRVSKGLSVDEIDRENTKFISDYEFYRDIYALNKIAKKWYEEAEGEEYNYTKYIDSISVFTPENMQKVGHPSNDKAFTNGIAEGICLICRISWEIDYFLAAANRSEFLRKSGDRKTRHSYQKHERNNPIVSMWVGDKYELNYKYDDELKQNEIYKKYIECKDKLGFSIDDMDKNFINKFLM